MAQLQAQPLPLSSSQKNWVLLGVGLGVFMSTLDVGIINVALPTLVQAFDTSFPTIQLGTVLSNAQLSITKELDK